MNQLYLSCRVIVGLAEILYVKHLAHSENALNV